MNSAHKYINLTVTDKLTAKELITTNIQTKSLELDGVLLDIRKLKYIADGKNVGLGEGQVYQKNQKNQLLFRSLKSSGIVSIETHNDNVIIGDNMVIHNVGNGSGRLFCNRVDSSFNFRTLVGEGMISVKTNPNEVVLEDHMSITNLGDGCGIFKDRVNSTFQFKSLVAGKNVYIESHENHIEISAAVSHSCPYVSDSNTILFDTSQFDETSLIACGYNHCLKAKRSAILGGLNNIIDSGTDHLIGSGKENRISDCTVCNCTILGGHDNSILNGSNHLVGICSHTTISGKENLAIVCGTRNKITDGSNHIILSGTDHIISADHNSGIGSGHTHHIECGSNHFILCGDHNIMKGSCNCMIGSGTRNSIEKNATNSAICSGSFCSNAGHNCLVGSGNKNQIVESSKNSAIASGLGNKMSGQRSFIPMGLKNESSGNDCWVGGQNASDKGFDECFVWSTCAKQPQSFNVHAPGGTYFYTTENRGVFLKPNANSWSIVLDSEWMDTSTVSCENILEQILELDICEYTWKDSENSEKHIGITAQDWHNHFGNNNEKPSSSIDSADLHGVALAGIKALYTQYVELVQMYIATCKNKG